jgi:hypothetical protein
MKLLITIIISTLSFCAYAQTKDTAKNKQVLRIIAFGAHPDDSELKASGVAALWAAQGHKVKFVAMTNGDIGHFKMAGAPLAKRRLRGEGMRENPRIETGSSRHP